MWVLLKLDVTRAFEFGVLWLETSFLAGHLTDALPVGLEAVQVHLKPDEFAKIVTHWVSDECLI